jgi:hypothetical protein
MKRGVTFVLKLSMLVVVSCIGANEMNASSSSAKQIEREPFTPARGR